MEVCLRSDLANSSVYVFLILENISPTGLPIVLKLVWAMALTGRIKLFFTAFGTSELSSSFWKKK